VRLVALWLLLSTTTALAEQPHGKYTLDRGELIRLTDEKGRPHPSCGGDKVCRGLATFVVTYMDTITVNERRWRFDGHTVLGGTTVSPPDAFVIARDPDSEFTIALVFGMDPKSSAATGWLQVTGSKNGKHCSDGWTLRGRYAR